MRAVKEVIVYTDGDSTALSTWSNVPYFFTETLMAKGVAVHRVNIKPPYRAERLYNLTWGRLLRTLENRGFVQYLRSFAYDCFVRFKIRQAERSHPQASAHIFLTFSHSARGIGKIPSVLFCDWNIDYHFKHFLERPPGCIERFALARQDRAIESADLVVSLFPNVAERMQARYANPQIRYLGNVVNALIEAPQTALLAGKKTSNTILFIGSRKYVEGALQLIQTFLQVKAQKPELQLHIIGMRAEDLGELPADVFCHGYLNKAIPAQRDAYYTLIGGARVVVNTQDKWGGFSSMIEAMYFYTPVITTPYEAFVTTFGPVIDFGFYCESKSPKELHQALFEIFETEGYESRCVRAHAAVAQFTWDRYIDKLLAEIAKL